MVSFPHCKINIGLRILNLRADGYHNIRTFFYPLPFHDILEIIPSGNLNVKLSGLPIAGKKEHNLCLKAFYLLKKDFPQLPYYTIYLHKNIPMGAGLGGGSADAAFLLKMLNKKAQLGLAQSQLSEYATKLGSDCSFFLDDKPALASGKGEILKVVEKEVLKTYYILTVSPNVGINTAKAYQQVRPQKEEIPLETLLQKPVSAWKNQIINDFEKPIFQSHPFLKEIKESLYSAGAIYASLSGSGSTIYGLFSKKITTKDFQFDQSILKIFPPKI